jgi:hypothetical protein
VLGRPSRQEGLESWGCQRAGGESRQREVPKTRRGKAGEWSASKGPQEHWLKFSRHRSQTRRAQPATFSRVLGFFHQADRKELQQNPKSSPQDLLRPSLSRLLSPFLPPAGSGLQPLACSLPASGPLHLLFPLLEIPTQITT